MGNTRPHESESTSRGDSISEHANEWIRHFSWEFEDKFANASLSLPADARPRDYQDTTIRATFEALLDTGMDAESFAETVGRVLIEQRRGSVKWNSELNRRRFELIDKEIQGTLEPAERIELAGLTRIMREQLESEANLPLEGARALHRRLLGLAGKDEPT